MSGMRSRPTRVGFPAVVLALAVAAGVAPRAADLTHISYSAGPNGYRGIVAANFDGAADSNDEILGDFGTLGVWLYDSGTWRKVATDNPEWMFVVHWGSPAHFEVVADFGSKGLWTWSHPGTWTQLSPANAEGGFAADDDGDLEEEIQIDFGGLGLWRYDRAGGSWRQYTASNPSRGIRCDTVITGYEEGLWAFDSGLWYVHLDGSAPTWTQLSASLPTGRMAAANFSDEVGEDPDDELVVEFSGLGTWIYNAQQATWEQMTASAAGAIVAAKLGGNYDWELLFADAGGHPWAWMGPGLTITWRQLSDSPMDAGFAVAWDPDAGSAGEYAGEQEFAVDFGALGLWQWNYTEGGDYVLRWTQLTAANPVFMVPCDYDNDGVQKSLVASFGPGTGLWIYRASPGTWSKMTDSVPDASLTW